MQERRTRFRSLLTALLALALGVRLFGLNWDNRHFFHPDERRIAMAVNEMSFEPLQLNPHFFAYGSFPMYVTRIATGLLGNLSPALAGYDGAVAVGRVVSALWGTLTVLLVVLLGRRLYDERVGMLAGSFLAITVLHVQNSHYATTDIALTCLVLAALFFMARAADHGRLRDWIGAGASIGFALATKVSAMPILLPLAVAVFLRWRAERSARRALAGGALAIACAGVAFVVGQPYAILDYEAFLHDIAEQSWMVRHAGALAYTNQYFGVPRYLYDLRELVLWGMGPFLGLAALWGAGRAVAKGLRTAPSAQWLLIAWALPFFVITGWFEVKFLRYLLPIYPLLALWGAAWLVEWGSHSAWGGRARRIVLVGSVAYLLAFLTIYARPFTEDAASDWFYRTVPAGTKVLSQDWDEGFPVPLPGRDASASPVVNFPYYDADSDAKIARLAAELASSEYAIFQTKRLYGAITQAATKFPRTARYFQALFAGDLGFTLEREFASRPRLFGIELPDELADESFTVYDHPRVVVFRNTSRLAANVIESRILHAFPSRTLTRAQILTARPVEPPRRQSGHDALIRASWPAAILVALILEALGLVAFVLMRALDWPVTGLYALSKVLGCLLLAYPIWLAASTGVVDFDQRSLVLWIAALGALAWFAFTRRAWAPLPGREIVATEAVFWFAFLLFLGLRTLNPEVFWGEKPMDFAFLNTLYRSSTLPPPEPWFAGSPLNYTYFGHFVVAALGRATGVHPALMFNLGIAAVASLTAAALFATGTVLGRSYRAGAATVLVTMLVGNLAGVHELLQRHVANFDYFWATSRVIHDTINEFPFWSFVFADLHAHVLVMPFALTFVCLLFLWLQRRDADGGLGLTFGTRATLLIAAALVLGAIAATNGWSMPTFGALLAMLLLFDWLAHARGGGALDAAVTLATGVIAPAAIVAGGAYVLFRPFWRSFTPPPRRWGWEVGPYATPSDYLLIFGTFLVVVVPLFFACWRDVRLTHGRAAGKRDVLVIAAGAVLLALSLVNLRALGGFTLGQATSVGTFALTLAVIGVGLALRSALSLERRTVLLLAAFAFAVTAGCEMVFVWDRMNTLFKFYLDAWLVLGLAAGAALAKAWQADANVSVGRILWRAATAVALAFAAFTAVTGAWGAVNYRHVAGPRFTLDGTGYLAGHEPHDAAAISWLNRTVSGTPTICEAQGPSYQEYGRVSMNTGLPTVLGWDYHVFQRGQKQRDIDWRGRDVEVIFTAEDRALVAAALRRYHVALLYVGPLERTTYRSADLDRFKSWTDLLAQVYRNEGVTIYAVKNTRATADVTSDVERVVTPPPTTAPPATKEPASDAPLGVMREPRGVACDAAGNVYVADFGNNRIHKFDRALKPVAAWGRLGGGVGEFRDPCGVTIGPDGNVYVADTWNSRVQVFDGAGGYLREWRADFFGPRGIAVAADGAVFVVDTGNNRVMRFSSAGAIELTWGGGGIEPGKLSDPMGIAIDAQARVWVCDNGNSRVQAFDRDGTLLSTFQVAGWQREAASEPGIAVTPSGTVWVTVPKAGEVRAYSSTGELLETYRRGAPDGPPFTSPTGITLRAVDSALVIVDLSGRVVTLAPRSPAPRVQASKVAGPGAEPVGDSRSRP